MKTDGPLQKRPALLYLGLFVAAAALNLAWLGRAPVADTTEARHAEVAREFAAGGHWLVPTLNGRPHLTKPPLTDWLSAVGIRIFGEAEFGARFMNALVAAAALALAAALAARLAGRAAALPTAALFFACPLYLALGRTISIDILLAVLATAGYLAVWEISKPDCGRPRLAALVFAAALGLGALAKGHVILLILAAPALVWLLAGRRRAALRRLAWPPAWILFLALALPWFIYIETIFPGWLKTIGQQEFSERLVGKDFGSATPGISVAYLLGGALTIMPLAIVGAFARPADDRERAARGLLLLWILVPLVVFSLASGQRANYVAPLVPAVACLAALGWRRLVEGWAAAKVRERFAAYASAALAMLIGAGGAVAVAWFIWKNEAEAPEAPASWGLAFAAAAGALAVLAGAACVVLLRRGRPASAAATFLAAALGAWGISVPLEQAYKEHNSTRTEVGWLLMAADHDQPVMAYRECPSSFLFYRSRRIPVAKPEKEPFYRKMLWPGAGPTGDLARIEDLVPLARKDAGLWLVAQERRRSHVQGLARGSGLDLQIHRLNPDYFVARLTRPPGTDGEKQP